MRRVDVRAGSRFGRLVVLEEVEPVRGRRTVACTCDCGSAYTVWIEHLRRKSNPVVSCGCYQTERRIKHGRHNSTEYSVWEGMKSRCNNPRDPRYKDYGGRGITIAEEWNSFQAFFADMGPRPAGYTIERIDNERGYGRENCKWASKSEQSLNKRNSLRVDGVPVAQFAEKNGLKPHTVRCRIYAGWPLDKLAEPLRNQPACIVSSEGSTHDEAGRDSEAG